MATAAVQNILRLRGRLVAAPTDLGAAFPHGGTQLGLVKQATFRYGIQTQNITAEEYGGITTEAVYAGEGAVLAGFMRDYDNDMIARLFPGTSAGASGARVVEQDAGDSGILLSSRSIVLLFAPIATNATTGHPHILMYNAVPMLDETADLQLHAGVEAAVAFVFRCIPDASSRLYRIGRRGDLSL